MNRSDEVTLYEREKKMIKKFICLSAFLYLVTSSGLGAAENPEAVSPGSDLRASVVNQVCPTFSWAQVPGAAAYQIAVFEMGQRFEGISYYENQASLSQPVLIKKISGSASSWTPSLEQALQNGGRYVWFVQAQDAYGTGAWSVGKKFAVRASLGLAEIREKVRQQLEAKGVKGDLVDEAFEGIGSQGIKSKSGGELKGKIQSGVKEEAQAKVEAQGYKEIRGKENQTIAGSTDFTAGTLGSEGDGNSNVYYGSGTDNSLPGSAYYNSFFGYRAGYNNDAGDRNTFMGYYTGYSNTSGSYNIFIGDWAGYSNTTGYSNTFIGYYTGYSNTTGDSNTFIGDWAGYTNTTGSSNTFLGYEAGESNTIGNRNTFLGYYAGRDNTTGYYNTFLGYYTGRANNTGDSNTFLGYEAGYSNTTGSSNTFLGYKAGASNTTGAGNVFVGFHAGYYEIGSNLLYIENSNTSSPLIYGEFENDLVTINGTFNVTDSNINVDTASKRARFKLQADGDGTNMDDYFNFTMRNDYGDVTLSVRDSSAGVWLPMLSYEYLNNKVDFKNNDIVTTGTISSGGGAYTSGGAWIEASSRDYKENIMELDQAESLQALTSLNPVRYNYKNKKDEEFLGFIAEDVPDLVAMNGRKGMRAMDIVAVLTKVVQDQQKKISKQEEFIHDQNEKNKIQDGLMKEQEEILRKQGQLINALKERIKKLEKESI